MARNADELARDLDMMENPMEWPHMRLPLVDRSRREGGFPRMGFMVAGMEAPDPVVYLGSIFGIGPYEKIEYTDFEAILDAGWEVD